MSIKESSKKSNQISKKMANLQTELPNEEEFDIVLVGKGRTSDIKKHFVSVILLVMLATASFGLGRYSFYLDKKTPVTLRHDDTSELPVIPNQAIKGVDIKATTIETKQVGAEEVVGSKNSTKYHYPWCSGAKTISPENLITFKSILEARNAGYTPAANCKGLK